MGSSVVLVTVVVSLSLLQGSVGEAVIVVVDVDVAVDDKVDVVGEVTMVDVFQTSATLVLVDPIFVTMTVDLRAGTCGTGVSHESTVSVTERVDKLSEVVGRTGEGLSVTYFVTVWMMVVSLHEHSVGTAARPILPELTVVVLLTVVVGV